MIIKMKRVSLYILILVLLSGCSSFRLAWRYERAQKINYITVLPSEDPSFDFAVLTVEEEFSGWDTKKKEDREEILFISAANKCNFKKDEVRIKYIEKRQTIDGTHHSNGDQAFAWFTAVKCIY